MRRSIAVVLALFAVACAPVAAEIAQAPAAPAKTQTCAERGGTVTKVCRRQTLQCVAPYPDAGKACDDKSDCMGRCLFSGDMPKSGTKVTGTCQKNDNPCGCFNPIVGGKIDAGICID